MSEQERCGLCGRVDHDISERLVEWTDAVLARVEGMPRWESIFRCPDLQGCRARVESAGGTWLVRDAVTQSTIKLPEAPEEVPL